MVVEPGDTELSIMRQCELLGLSRAAYYYRPHPVSKEDVRLMRLIDEEYTRHPFYDSRSLRNYLEKQGHRACRDRVRRLMGIMGIEAVYPRKRLSLRNKEHTVYPYLLRNLEIVRPDQVWCVDVTYIRLRRSFAYLVAVMDWFSRYVLSWELSLSLEAWFCVTALESALEVSIPDILNSDQGSQFTSAEFTTLLLDSGVAISMDGKGRVFDNIMIERLWPDGEVRRGVFEGLHPCFCSAGESGSIFRVLQRRKGTFKSGPQRNVSITMRQLFSMIRPLFVPDRAC
jgi:putative transposase